LINKPHFYLSIKSSLFGGKLTQDQVNGMEAIIDGWKGTDIRQLSYALATVFHECAKTMQPITEYGPVSYFNKYETGTDIGKRLGNTAKGDGYKFRGRGFVQITGRANYKKAGDKLGLDLITKPEQALKLPIATAILHQGMAEGWFTGKKLGDYINPRGCDFAHARRIINGMDCAGLIASYAEKFWRALQ